MKSLPPGFKEELQLRKKVKNQHERIFQGTGQVRASL